MPDYEVLLDAENDCVTFTNRHFDESLEKKMNQLAKNKNMIEEVVSNGKLPKKLQKKVATIADKISKEKDRVLIWLNISIPSRERKKRNTG
ncbi:hypothetical protein [Proteus mirabilis]|uniref:hypothetical protein n=1 Tax=Proteus mirabilis TaxID=584 RepID=UPI002FC81D45